MRSMVEGARNESKIIHCVAIVGRADKRLSVIAEITPSTALRAVPLPRERGRISGMVAWNARALRAGPVHDEESAS